ncbi:PE family protein, partial [Mycobacterium sp. E796]|uniref:PE family protein n=1 Tax=Mycobacterium sp. E796 TaxID=1834151 RepID=UPI000A5E3AD9
MSYVVAAPEMLAAASADLEGIRSALSAANAVAAAPTSGVVAAGADEVSVAIAALFSGHAELYQALSARAASFHQQFVRAMSAGGALYAEAEAAN